MLGIKLINFQRLFCSQQNFNFFISSNSIVIYDEIWYSHGDDPEVLIDLQSENKNSIILMIFYLLRRESGSHFDSNLEVTSIIYQ